MPQAPEPAESLYFYFPGELVCKLMAMNCKCVKQSSPEPKGKPIAIACPTVLLAGIIILYLLRAESVSSAVKNTATQPLPGTTGQTQSPEPEIVCDFL